MRFGISPVSHCGPTPIGTGGMLCKFLRAAFGTLWDIKIFRIIWANTGGKIRNFFGQPLRPTPIGTGGML